MLNTNHRSLSFQHKITTSNYLLYEMHRCMDWGTVGYTKGTDNTGSFQDLTNSAGLTSIGSLMLLST